MFRNIFRRKGASSEVSSPEEYAHYNSDTGELLFGSNRIRVIFPECEDEYEGQRSICIAVNGRSIYVTHDEFVAMGVYFNVIFPNKEE